MLVRQWRLVNALGLTANCIRTQSVIAADDLIRSLMFRVSVVQLM